MQGAWSACGDRVSRHGARCGVAFLLLAASLASSSSAIAGGSSGNDPYPDEISYFGERVYSLRKWPPDWGWGISYFRTVAPHLAWSLAYLNDAHFPGHHRDGVAAEGWFTFIPYPSPLTLSAGVGTFYYYDTVFAENSAGYADAHGWAWLGSVRATLQPRSWQHMSVLRHMYVEARVDYTSPSKSIETTSFGLGLGYRGNSDDPAAVAGGHGSGDLNEVVASYYKTVTNSFNSGSHQAGAGALDYRRTLSDESKVLSEIRLSVGYLYEGDTQLIRRSGATAEVWGEPSFGSGRWSIGAGIGFYSAIDKYRPSPGRHVSGIVSTTMSYHPFDASGLDLRFIWHRIVTDYNRDTDVVLFGLGYRF
jgi:hypothetical protein